MCVLVEVEGAHHLYILFLPDPAELNYIYMNSWKIVFSLTTAHRITSVFKDQEAVKRLSSLHDKYVIVPADKASNNIVFVCKSYYFECLIKELGINSNTSIIPHTKQLRSTKTKS